MNNINISTAGFGYMGRLHTVAYRSMPLCYENFNYDILLYKLLSGRKIFNNAGYTETISSFNDLVGTDILDICTPNFMHSELVKNAISIGIKNIYCEKPLTGFLKEEEELVKLAEGNKLNTQIGFVLRFLPAVIRAKKLIEEGEIGDIINFNCHMYHSSYLNPQRPMSWRLEKNKSGGGALVDLGIHLIDLIHYVMGPVTDVKGYVKTFIDERPFDNKFKKVDVDDLAHMELVVNDSILGTLDVSRIAAGKGEDTCLEIFGTRGSLRIEPLKPEFPSVYLLKDNNRREGNYILFPDVEKDISLLYPSSKYSLGWMVNCHMASLYSFIARINGVKFNYISTPTFEDSLNAIRIIERGYKN